MKILDPQSAVLTNIEVLAYLTANPPRRPPNPPPNSRHWVPSPDLRDHNTVIKEIHNYIARLSPHIQNYPRYIDEQDLSRLQQQQRQQQETSNSEPSQRPRSLQNTPTPLDHALRSLIVGLKPFALTKAEVLTIVNLGVGLGGPPSGETEGEGNVEGEAADGMDVDEEVDGGYGGGGGDVAEEGNEYEEAEQIPEGTDPDQNAEGAVDTGAEAEEEGREEGGEAEAGLSEDDYGALALLDTVIEEREERLSNEDVGKILGIIRECLGQGQGQG